MLMLLLVPSLLCCLLNVGDNGIVPTPLSLFLDLLITFLDRISVVVAVVASAVGIIVDGCISIYKSSTRIICHIVLLLTLSSLSLSCSCSCFVVAGSFNTSPPLTRCANIHCMTFGSILSCTTELRISPLILLLLMILLLLLFGLSTQPILPPSSRV